MLRITSICFLLEGYSSAEDFTEKMPPAPYLSTVMLDLKKVVAEALCRTGGGFRADQGKSDLIIAVAGLPRSSKSEETKRLTYSAFFINKYVSS